MPGSSEVILTGNAEKSKPLSIGFDAKRALFNTSGLGNYSRNLLNGLAKQYPENSYYLFSPGTKNRINIEKGEQFNLVTPTSAFFRVFSSAWRGKYMTSAIMMKKLDIFHGLSHELPIGIEKTGVKSIVTIHDLIFLRYPEYYKLIDAKIYRRKIIHACEVSDQVIAISNQTKSDIIDYLNISPDKISVIHQGCNPMFWTKYSKEFFEEVRKNYNIPENYILYVGTIEDRKNLLGIIKAMHLYNINIPLVVVGRKVKPYYKKVMNYILEKKLDNIVFPEQIQSDQLPVLYQNAKCFVYPSFFEGFGLPVLEALVSRTPVVTTSGGCFPESAGPGSLYVDPFSAEKIGEAIISVINNDDLRSRMISIGEEYANNFKEEIIVKKYMNLYHSLSG
jgi:glycosyltransferase involved in cell wall biosynthesis